MQSNIYRNLRNFKLVINRIFFVAPFSPPLTPVSAQVAAVVVPGPSLHVPAVPPVLPPAPRPDPRGRGLLPGSHHAGLHLSGAGDSVLGLPLGLPTVLANRQREAAPGIEGEGEAGA